MSSKGMLTFTCLKTSKFSYVFLVPFLLCKAWEKGGGMCFFIISSLMTILGSSSTLESWSSSFDFFSPFYFSNSLPSSCFSLGGGWTTSLPLLRVITALTSLTFEDSPSWASTSWIPLGFWWGWKGNFPFSYRVLRLVSLEMEYWTLSIF